MPLDSIYFQHKKFYIKYLGVFMKNILSIGFFLLLSISSWAGNYIDIKIDSQKYSIEYSENTTFNDILKNKIPENREVFIIVYNGEKILDYNDKISQIIGDNNKPINIMTKFEKIKIIKKDGGDQKYLSFESLNLSSSLFSSFQNKDNIQPSNTRWNLFLEDLDFNDIQSLTNKINLLFNIDIPIGQILRNFEAIYHKINNTKIFKDIISDKTFIQFDIPENPSDKELLKVLTEAQMYIIEYQNGYGQPFKIPEELNNLSEQIQYINRLICFNLAKNIFYNQKVFSSNKYDVSGNSRIKMQDPLVNELKEFVLKLYETYIEKIDENMVLEYIEQHFNRI